jgi:hypothetical protein
MSTLETPLPTGLRSILLALLNTEDGGQTRVSIRRAVVQKYAQAMCQQQSEGNLRFPAIIAYTVGTTCWLADGYHRVLAARQVGLSKLLADVRPGTQRDALLSSISANTEHGLPRSNADKHKAVKLLLADAEWNQWSDREIARRCQVGHVLVSRLRKGASVPGKQMRERKVRRGGQVYEMEVPQTASEAASVDARPLSVPSEPLSAPAAPFPDRLGMLVPEARQPVFAAAALYDRAKQLFAELTDLVDQIAQQPGGALYRQHLQRNKEGTRTVFESASLRAALQRLVASEPYAAYCPICELTIAGLQNPACATCRGLGWTTHAAFAACSEGHRQAVLKRKG